MLVEYAVDRWIGGLLERDFDRPFESLLRALGFYDIHFTHGSTEQGKDFIAKLRTSEGGEVQYAFQNKSGDVNVGAFDRMLGQLYKLTWDGPTHPSFVPGLPRMCILVCTGRLVGGALTASHQFGAEVERRSPGVTFDVWDRARLVELLMRRDLEGVLLPDVSVEMLSLLRPLMSEELNDRRLERLLAARLPHAGSKVHARYVALLETMIAAALLLDLGRPFLAATAALHAVRIGAIWSYEEDALDEDLVEFHKAAIQSLRLVCCGVVEQLPADHMEPRSLIGWVGGPVHAIITYPVACARIIEVLGILCITEGEFREGDRDVWLGKCEQFLYAHPGATRPVSDRFAPSLAPALAALAAAGRTEVVRQVLSDVSRWVIARADAGHAFASAYSTPQEELEVFFGGYFDFVEWQPRRETQLVAAVCDASLAFAPDMLPHLINTFSQSRAKLIYNSVQDSALAFLMTGKGVRAIRALRYQRDATVAPAHHEMSGLRVVERRLGVEVPMLMACLLRDRLFSESYGRVRTKWSIAPTE